MTISQVTTLQQFVEILSVDSVVVSDVVDDGSFSGTFVRQIRFFGEPLGVNGPPVLVVQIKSTTKLNLEVATPTLNF